MGPALPASPQRGRQGRGGGRGEATDTRSAPARRKRSGRSTRAGRPERADQRPRGRGRESGPQGPPEAPRQEPSGPEAPKGAAQGGPGGARQPHSTAGAGARATNGSPQRSGWRGKRPGAEREAAEGASPHKCPSGKAGGKGGGPGRPEGEKPGGQKLPEPTRRSRGRARRAGAAPPRGGGPGASGDAECAKGAADRPRADSPRPRRPGAHYHFVRRAGGPGAAHRDPPEHGERGQERRAASPGEDASPRSGAKRPGAAAPQASANERARRSRRPRAARAVGGAKRSLWVAPIYLIIGHYSVRVSRLTMKNAHEIYHNSLVYTFPDGSQDILICTNPIFREPGWEAIDSKYGPGYQPQPTPREAGVKSTGENAERSMRRARAKLRRLALANGFEYFVTFTLDPAKIDRHDGAAVTRALGQWCDNMVRRHGLRYILVPERHKDGAFHFHGFMAGPGLKAVDSGIEWDGRPVYNLPQWSFGFTTAQRLYGDYHAAVGYCCKYIGKQAGERPLGRWYYSGGALHEPHKDYVDLDWGETCEDAVEFSIPGAKIKLLRQKGGQNNEN